MFTGYYIKNGHIYGLNGYTKFRIADGHIYEDDKGYTKCWIHNKAIFKVGEGKTRFFINADKLYGPNKQLPWLPIA